MNATKVLIDQWMCSVSLWIKALCPTDGLWRHISEPTLAEVMTWCRTASSHCLEQYQLVISKVQYHSYDNNSIGDYSATNHCNWLENYLYQVLSISPKGQWVRAILVMINACYTPKPRHVYSQTWQIESAERVRGIIPKSIGLMTSYVDKHIHINVQDLKYHLRIVNSITLVKKSYSAW